MVLCESESEELWNTSHKLLVFYMSNYNATDEKTITVTRWLRRNQWPSGLQRGGLEVKFLPKVE
jgi:hypothetical protein